MTATPDSPRPSPSASALPDTPPRAAFDESVAAFGVRVERWINENRQFAPVDYGAILPPELVSQGVGWQRRLYAAGFAGIDWPVEYGGQGLSADHRAAWVRACATAGVPPFINMVGVVLAGGSTLMFGTEQQRADHLHAIIRAERLWCQLFSEPGAGSDLGSLSTRAEADGDTFVINGQKVWTSGGRYSDWGILMARTDPHAAKHRGISFFLFDMTLPGVTVRPLKQMTGEAEFDEVFFDDVRIPASALLGPLHGGWGVGMATLTNERGSIGTASISLTRRMDSMIAGFTGRELTSVQRDRVVRGVSAGRALTMLSQRQGPVASTAASLLKLGVTELMFEAAETRVDVAGAHAMLADDPAGRQLLSAPGGRIAGGTTQIQRNLIGERLLGLPAEPRS